MRSEMFHLGRTPSIILDVNLHREAFRLLKRP